MRPLSFALTVTAGIASIASAGSLPSEIAVIGEPSQVLNVTFQTSTQVLEVQTGQSLTSNDTTNRPQPNLANSGSVIKKDQKYVFMMVDPDTNATDPTSVALHTIVTNLTIANSSSGNTLAQYIAPEPSGTSPHNYTLLLFKQPSNFTVASMYDPYLALDLTDVYNRVNFPLRQFINSTGLDEPVAANWFKEKSESTTSTTATATATATTSASGTATATSTATPAVASSSVASPVFPSGRSLGLVFALLGFLMGM